MPTLTDLPSEIRYKIYDYCIDTDLQSGSGASACSDDIYCTPLHPRPLFAINQKIRREVSSITTWRVGVNVWDTTPGEADTRTAEEFDTAATTHTDALWHCKRIRLSVRIHQSYAEDCSMAQIWNLETLKTIDLFLRALAEYDVKRDFIVSWEDDEAGI